MKPNCLPWGGDTTSARPCPGGKRGEAGFEPPLPRPLEPPSWPNGSLLEVGERFLGICGYTGRSRQNYRVTSDYGKLTSRG
jgi:hypothetical protein